jgi:hypothetical protein
LIFDAIERSLEGAPDVLGVAERFFQLKKNAVDILQKGYLTKRRVAKLTAQTNGL